MTCARLAFQHRIPTASTAWIDAAGFRTEPQYIKPLYHMQAIMEVPLHQKLDALWSFIKTHLRVGPLLPV